MTDDDLDPMTDLAPMDDGDEDLPLPPADMAGKQESDQALVTALSGQHAIDAMLGRVYQRLGGEDFVADWAEMYPGQFMKLFAGLRPGLQPTSPFQGDVHLHVHPAMGPSPLDAPIDSTCEEVE